MSPKVRVFKLKTRESENRVFETFYFLKDSILGLIGVFASNFGTDTSYFFYIADKLKYLQLV